jgi:hypothetical protein
VHQRQLVLGLVIACLHYYLLNFTFTALQISDYLKPWPRSPVVHRSASTDILTPINGIAVFLDPKA